METENRIANAQSSGRPRPRVLGDGVRLSLLRINQAGLVLGGSLSILRPLFTPAIAFH